MPVDAIAPMPLPPRRRLLRFEPQAGLALLRVADSVLIGCKAGNVALAEA
jgi:hypothetical protein